MAERETWMGKKGGRQTLYSADIPTGGPHGGHFASDAVTATLCHNTKQKD